MISVIHPSRGRPGRALKVIKAMLQTATTQIQYILSIDSDDEKANDYKVLCDGIPNVTTLIGDNLYCVGAINNGAKHSTGDIIIAVSDDFDEWQQGWDKLIIDALRGYNCALLKTNDGSQGWIATLPIIDRALYNKLGYVYNPIYKHMFCDTDLSSVCDLLGVTVYRNDILFKHNHYTKLKNKDSVNERNDATWNEGEATYLKRWKENFGLSPDEIKGRIKDDKHKNWVKRKLNV